MTAKKTKKTSPSTAKKGLLCQWPCVLILITLLALSACTYAAYRILQLPEATFVQYFKIGAVDLTAYDSFADANSALNTAAESFLNKPVNFTSSRGSFTLSLAEAGVSIDTTAVENELSGFMQESSAPDKILTYLFGANIKVPITVNEEALKTSFATSGIEQGLKEASFVMEGKTVSISPEQVGYGIDVATLSKDIQAAWEEGRAAENMDLPLLSSEPTVTTQNLSPLLAKAQQASALTFDLTDDYGVEYKVAFGEHLDWLIPGTEKTFGFAEGPFFAYLQSTLSPAVEQDPQSVIITQSEEGTYDFEGSARFGEKIDNVALENTLEAALEAALNPPADQEESTEPLPITIPLTRELPPITVPDSLKALGITDLVGVGYSDFGGSPSGRVHNINEGINQFNGLLIGQGEEFSFMDHLSPVDAEHGFLPELVIKGDETIPEYGGGMCQVSSTLFRAALYSGLPITARTNHSYAVSYYARPFGYGLDATVYDPAPDLKFINDTPGALLIQSYTDGDSAYYVLYGTNDGRRVTMDGPVVYDRRGLPPAVTEYVDTLAPGERKLKEHGHQGFKVDWVRTIERADGTTTTETIHSDYEARPEKWEEGKAED